MKIRKLTSLLLALALILALGAACGSSKPTEPETPATPTDTPAPASPDNTEEPAEPEAFSYPIEGDPEISVWRSWRDDPYGLVGAEDYTPGMEKLEEYTGVHVKYVNASENAAQEQLNVMLATGEYPDVLSAVEQYYVAGLPAMCEAEISIDLTELAEKFMPNYMAARQKLPTYTVDTIADDGHMYGVYILTVSENIPQGPAIRKDWLDDLGLDIPVTYDDYHDVLEAFKVSKGATAGLFVTNYGMPYYNYLAAGYDVAAYISDARDYKPIYVVDGEVKYGPLESGWVDFTAMMRDWYAEGLIYQDFMSVTNMTQEMVKIGANDTCGLLYTYQFQLTTIPLANADEDCEFIPISDAVQYEGQELHLKAPITLIQNQGSVITTCCEDPELVCRWMDWGYTDAAYDLGNNGIEGVNFTYDADGNVVYADEIVTAAAEMGITPRTYCSQYCSNPTIYHQNLDLQNLDDAKTAAANEAWGYSDDDYAFPVNVTMTQEESDEFKAIWSEIRTLTCEYYMGFVLGERDLDAEYDYFIEQLKTLGIDRLLEIQQNVYDRYISRS